jgi:tetratricopeptide (TPR) repeat protein
LRECIDESVARAVVVTGPPGQGKSRLRYEFVHWARLRGDLAILTAWADPVGAGSAFVLVRQLVRRAVGLREGDPAVAQLTKLRSHVADIFRSGGDSGRIADFLGELLSVPSTDPPSQELRAARNDPQIMAAWLARSFGEWLAAECAARPLLIVLEDLHWGDMPSVAYLGDALRALASKPLMLLALGRPEMSDLFPKLWAGADKNEVSLGRLTRRASERLVRAALGDSVAADALARIVETADGNAFYLEELIRRVAEGGGESGGDSLPETVLALVQSRLERLEPEARRIVRAASVFGEVCWNGGVAELLGGPMAPGDLEGWLAVLAEREVLTLSPESRFPAEREYIFRHGLLREAAYAMLTEADRAAGHRLAGSWLEAAGEKDALTLADHFERGEEPKRAVPWLLRAAQAALDGGNTQAAIALGHRAIACRPVGAERGRIRQVQGRAHFVRGNLPESIEMSREAMDLLPVGSTLWFVSAAGAFFTGTLLGDRNVTAPVLKAILEVPTEPAPSGPYGFAVYVTCLGLALMAKLEFARSFLKRAEGVGPASDPDPVFVLYLRGARGFLEVMAGNVGGALTHLSEGRKLAERTGDVSGRANVAMITVEALAQTGDCERTEAALRDLLSLSEPRGLGALSDWGTLHVALARMNAHRADEAIASLSTLLDRSDRYLATCARAFLALAHAQVGDLVAATKEAKTSLEEGAAFPVTETVACGALALAELRRGHAQDALAFAERALDGESRAPWPSIGSSLILTRAEALSALGRVDDARAVIREARHRVLRIAGTLEPFPELRESCLTRIDTHVRTLELASEWLDGLEITE